MTLVLECAALVGGVAAAVNQHTGQKAKERSTALALYARFFSTTSALEDHAESEPTVLSVSLPLGLHQCAKEAIQAIEEYQRSHRDQKWFWRRSEVDTQSQVFEEMKRWLLTLSDSSVRAPDVSNRLDYCFQFLLRPDVYSERFLTTMAQVCSQLEKLLRHAISSQHTGAKRIGNILAQGRHLTESAVSVLLFALADEKAVPGRSQSLASLLVQGELEPEAVGPVNVRTDLGRVIQALLGSDHLRDLCSVNRAPTGTEELQQVLEETGARWTESTVSAESGLRESFRCATHRCTRLACLDLCRQIDRVVFFLVALRPYDDLAGKVGDIALCWLREKFGHLLSELERGLLQLHQSRLEVTRAAKLHLQELAKRLPASNTEAFRWMQGLRQVDEPEMDSLHKELVKLCTDLRVASTATRQAELREIASDELKALTSGFNSAEFQARCMPELRSRLVDDGRQLTDMASTQESALAGGTAALVDAQ